MSVPAAFPTGALHWATIPFLLLLICLPLAVLFISRLKRKSGGLRFPALSFLIPLSREAGQMLRHLPLALRLAALLCLVLVLARPQSELRLVDREEETLDIILALDLSESMRAYDIRPNRLTVAKRVLSEFIDKRQQDRFGLVVFSGHSLTLSPLTIDGEAVRQSLRDVNTQTVRIEGTAIGEAVLMAANRLLEPSGTNESDQPGDAGASPANAGRGKIIILATDGVSNRGVHPLLAAQVAAAKGLKLYTIGLGRDKRVLRYEKDPHGRRVPLRDVYGRLQYWEKPDETVLRKMADLGGGRYFRAGNQAKFKAVMQEIDRMEKRKITLKRRSIYREEYVWLLLAAMLLLVLESTFKTTRLRSWI